MVVEASSTQQSASPIIAIRLGDTTSDSTTMGVSSFMDSERGGDGKHSGDLAHLRRCATLHAIFPRSLVNVLCSTPVFSLIIDKVTGKRTKRFTVPCSRDRPRHRISCPRLSFPTRLVHNYERQNDVVQHAHSCRLHLKSCPLFVLKEVWAVELSNHRLFIHGHQLRIVVQRRR